MNVILVHGSFGKPFENWFPWFEAELAKKDIPCIIPTFPTPDHQNYLDWERLMDYYSSIGVINKNSILIGHSCGAIFLVKYILEHKLKVKGLVCVSGYNNFISGNAMMDSLNSSFYIKTPDFNIKDYVTKVIAFYGNNDPNIPREVLECFAQSIGAKSFCVEGAGHFNSAAGYDRCEIVLNTILQEFKYPK